MARTFDLVAFGATGFTGRQAVRYLEAHAPAGLRWAAAGRDRRKLEALGAPAIVVADGDDPASVDALAASARVVLSTAGPFAKYGTSLVDACVRHRTGYADITGETAWVRSLIDRHHARAAAEGTRIVPFCGFDSVPSDLGTWRLVRWLREHRGQGTRKVSASYTVRGGFNGGTLASGLAMAEAGEVGAGDVLLLNPPSHRTDDERARSPEFRGVRRDPERGVWLAPFLMASINTRVVRRSAALAEDWGEAYGPRFAYEEAHEFRKRSAAEADRAVQALLGQAFRHRWGRAALRRFGPAPGEGPSEKTMAHGFFRARFLAEADDGRKVLATMAAKGDPGNRVTVRILCEAALALATQAEALPGAPGRGGVLTPATGLGEVLWRRLEATGTTWEVEERG